MPLYTYVCRRTVGWIVYTSLYIVGFIESTVYKSQMYEASSYQKKRPLVDTLMVFKSEFCAIEIFSYIYK